MSRRRVMPKALIVELTSSSSERRSKNSASFGLELGKPASTKCDAERVERLHDLQLLPDGERHSVTAHAVPQGGVVELDLCHLMPFANSRESGESLYSGPRAQHIAAPAARRLR